MERNRMQLHSIYFLIFYTQKALFSSRKRRTDHPYGSARKKTTDLMR